MKVTLKTFHGQYLSAQPDGTFEVRPWARGWEKFDVELLEPVDPPPNPPDPPQPITDYRAWFFKLVEGRPFGQQTLLDLEPLMLKSGVLLTPPNAAGDRTKIGIPVADGVMWVRVGFGEGQWVWVIQSS